MALSTASITRADLAAWYRRNRERSRALFDLIDPDAYFTRPIALRNPIVFYEGHLPAFSIIAFLKRGLGMPGVDERLEKLFARGIDPESESTAVPRSGADTRWPSRAEVLGYGEAVDAAVLDAMERGYLDLDMVPADPCRQASHAEAVFTALEHEAMHQETLLYMWRRLPYALKRKPAGVAYEIGDTPPPHRPVKIPPGAVTLGASRDRTLFGWDNEFDELRLDVSGFEIDEHSVTNRDFMEFIADGGYDRGELWSEIGWEWRLRENVRFPAFWVDAASSEGGAESRSMGRGQWFWHGMFEDIALPLSWPVYVSQAEADAYARWKGRRLPTEAEYHRAAFGTPAGVERALPWGDGGGPLKGNFDFRSWEPVPAGARQDGVSAWGVHDLVGNGWEWTSTEFGPFPGFRAMPSYPEYSAEFFDGQHIVLKGASPGTARELVRRSFRNWFRPNYPYVYAKFRTVL